RHAAEHLERRCPAIERRVAEQAARRERDGDRHARENQREEQHHAQRADEADAHFSALGKIITTAASAPPIRPNSTGIQYRMRWIERSEVTSWNTSVSCAAFQPSQAMVASTGMAMISAKRRSHGTQRGAIGS